MELFPVGKVFDFMGVRRYFIALSVVVIVGSLVLLKWPGAKLGTDFRGGTEVEVAFNAPTDAGEVRAAITASGFSQPDVIKVDDPNHPNRFLVRVQEVSTIGEAKQAEIDKLLCYGANLPADQCSKEHTANEVKFSPGGDKITVRFSTAPDLAWVKQEMAKVQGVELREGASSLVIQNAREHKVDIQLKSKGDQLMDGLRRRLGPGRVPATALRVEWIGPKAGAQLRNAAIISVAISIVFIMAYIAFRFDLRFAPGAVVAMVHDAVGVVGVLVVLGKEINLSSVAAVLTIVGYSVNDTVVVYDRVRENLGKLRGATFSSLINVSLSEMLSRTLLTSGTTVMSLLAFFLWGTGTLKEFALTLIIGIVFGTYSSIYIALPLTEYLDTRFFTRAGGKKKSGRPVGKKASAPV